MATQQASPWIGGGRPLHIQEVGPRDGLQMESAFVQTSKKIALIDKLSFTGVSKIEVTAFVSPQAIPALRDAEVVMREIQRRPGVVYSCLVPNLRGAERAIEARADELNLVMSATEAHNIANLRMTRAHSFEVLSGVIRLGCQAEVAINVSLSCAFGCPLEGHVDLAMVMDWAAFFIGLGVRGITLCDTTGMAYPTQVTAIVQAVRERFTDTELTLHFHNTRGMGLANIIAAIDTGANRFDASVGGIGGCPYAPGASGNVCTEDTVHALELMGFDTGCDLTALLTVAALIPGWIGHEVPSQVLRAGRRDDLHSVPAEFAVWRHRAQAKAALA
jgi:hydroxymethylglutaryl-CoA lyase